MRGYDPSKVSVKERKVFILRQVKIVEEIKENEDILPVLDVLSDLQLSADDLFGLLSFDRP